MVPNAPTTIGITTTFFICHNLATSSFKKLYFLMFSCSLSHTLVSPYFVFTLATTVISGLLTSFMWLYCIVKSHRILKFSLSTTLSGSCSYQSLALLNPSLSQNYQCIHLPILSCLYLYSFWASLPHSLNIVSFLVPHIQQRSELAVCQYCTKYS